MPALFSKEAKGLGRIAYQDVLGVLIVVEHHFVIFAPDAGLLVSAECGMSRIRMVTVCPHATGLNLATELVGPVPVAGPDAGAETVECVVCHRKRVLFVLELRDRDNRPEYLFLEDA